MYEVWVTSRQSCYYRSEEWGLEKSPYVPLKCKPHRVWRNTQHKAPGREGRDRLPMRRHNTTSASLPSFRTLSCKVLGLPNKPVWLVPPHHSQELFSESSIILNYFCACLLAYCSCRFKPEEEGDGACFMCHWSLNTSTAAAATAVTTRAVLRYEVEYHVSPLYLHGPEKKMGEEVEYAHLCHFDEPSNRMTVIIPLLW